MVEENDIINRSCWTYPYLAYVISTQICVGLKMCDIYIYECHTYFLTF